METGRGRRNHNVRGVLSRTRTRTARWRRWCISRPAEHCEWIRRTANLTAAAKAGSRWTCI